VQAERVQKVLAQLGLASRREAESWIRAGRLTVNGKPAELGMRVGAQDQIKLDGRLIRRRAAAAPRTVPVILCHRSPGEPLLDERGPRAAPPAAGTAAAASKTASASMAARLPRKAGRRFISISPMPTVDGGLELLTADGAVASRLQRAMRDIEMEFSLRVRGELSEQQRQAILKGLLDRGSALRIGLLEPAGGEASNRWYRLVATGASGNEIRQLIERAAATLVRLLRTRIGALTLPRSLPRGHWRELSPAELSAVAQSAGAAGSPGSDR
jgi:23S rRNA pseudouridine2605 synthase